MTRCFQICGCVVAVVVVFKLSVALTMCFQICGCVVAVVAVACPGVLIICYLLHVHACARLTFELSWFVALRFFVGIFDKQLPVGDYEFGQFLP